MPLAVGAAAAAAAEEPLLRGRTALAPSEPGGRDALSRCERR